ncbi:MAG: hypothetical protein E5W38_20800 [Mesorhizobium sp.]|nr:MAG: hypothetical protein E5W38_20800 [Mesorhizobium sp.]
MAGFNTIIRRCVLTALLGLAAASVVVEGYAMAPKLGPGQKPLRSVVVPVHRNVREQFFNQLQLFADMHGFTIRIAPATPDNEYFSVSMHRVDIKVFCDSVWDPEEFEISFYQNGDRPVASGSVEKLVGDLKQTVEQVPGVTVSKDD